MAMGRNWWVLVAVVGAAATAGWLSMRLLARQEVDTADIDRDLAELADALRLDETIEASDTLPPVPRAAVPNPLALLRPVLFWRPVLEGGERTSR